MSISEIHRQMIRSTCCKQQPNQIRLSLAINKVDAALSGQY